MGDKVIRITSQQGFADQWKSVVDLADAANTKPQTLNLVDFTIPTGYVIDMSKSYVAFNAQVDDDAGNEIVNASFALKTDGVELFNVPNSALIRNCAISCSSAGQLESIRRNDTLSCGIWGLAHTAEEKKGDMNTFSAYNNGAGEKIYTSFNLDRVSSNITPDGGTTLTGLDGLAVKSANISRDIKVPLKDMFGVGVVEDWDTSKWGETRIHLETNFQQLVSKQWGGDEDTTTGFATAMQGAITAPGADVAAGTAVDNPATLEHSYGEFPYSCPFYVGQTVLCQYDVAGTPLGAPVELIIETMQFQIDNATNPITGDSKVLLGFNVPYYTNATGGDLAITNVLIKAKIVPTLKNTINRAELVLYTKDEGQTSSAYEYITYTTEEDNGLGNIDFNKGYMLEPECENVLIALCNDSQILPNHTAFSYRFALNSDEQTGNRDIRIKGETNIGSSLQYERLSRCLDRSAQIPFRNKQLAFYKQTAAQPVAYPTPISMICETVEVMPTSKMLNLNIASEGTGLQQLILYKQIPKRISV